MRDELLFGAAYYPEYMPYDRIHQDLAMMREAGMNVVRIAESTWSTLEPQEGVFDFSYIDAVLEEAERTGMQVIVGTPTYAVPTWLVRLDADVLVTGREGQAQYGARQLINLWNPTFRRLAERVIRRLISHTASFPCVIGFQIDNETKHYGNYGTQAQAAFRAYLQDTFGTVEALNEAFHLAYWSNSLSSWDDFPDMRGCVNGGLAAEYERFLRRQAAEYLSWQAALVREYKRDDQFITHNFDFEWKKFGADIAQDGYSYGVQPERNHSVAASPLTLAGTDIYHPTQDALTGAEIAFGGDEIRCLRQNNYLVLECQAQAFKAWTPYPGQLRLHAYSHLASGALGQLYWNWHSIHNGYEAYWRGLLGHDLEKNPAWEEAARIGKEWQRLGAGQLTLRKKNAIALVIDTHSLTALRWFPIDRDLSYNDVVRWMYDSLYEMNLECDVVDVNALQPERYRMIVTPALYSVTEETLRALERFVEGGGVLVSSFRSFVADEHLSIYPDTQPHLLHRCVGMRYQQFTEPGTAILLGRPVRYFAELLQCRGAESLGNYEHRYWGRYAALTRHAYGQGAAYYVGCFTGKETLKEVYADAARRAGLQLPEVSWPVILRSGEDREGRTVHYVLHYSQAERTFSCPWERVRDLLSEKIYRRGEEISLGDWNVMILQEEIVPGTECSDIFRNE
ncbi:MAG: beta-galactosidase [Lachnospiraceae bacterium]|nr:beta-galactosidase [Lachnospiraceae bacterium]